MTNDMTLTTEKDYNELLNSAVAVIETARCFVARQVNNTAIQTRWNIGQLLYERKIGSGHGDSVVRRLSSDLKERYPDMGMSTRSLWDMKRFYLRFADSDPKVQRSVALLSWRQVQLLIVKDLDDAAVLYYAHESVAKNWNRDLLLNAIKMEMHKACALTNTDNNFIKTLSTNQAQYANEVFKETYNLGFLGVTEPLHELELEHRLVAKITRFLMELGRGFTFIGNQHVLEYEGMESRVDMLFFHRNLKALVAVDLKIGPFLPEYAGKMNYYLSLLDKLERGEGENKSIGIILCATKNHSNVELALQDINKPIGVADYQLIGSKDEIQKLLADEICAYEKDIKHSAQE